MESNKITAKRDTTIDNLRGFAMLWVILVHVFYWGFFFTNHYILILQSFCLFEMPLFFFVTGASNSFSKNKSYWKFIFTRFRRMLIPYWFYAILCVALTLSNHYEAGSLSITAIANILASWIIPADRQITSTAYANWALWYIPVYLCITPLIPVLLHFKAHRYRYAFGAILLILFFTTCMLKLGWVQNVFFYLLWVYLGVFYKEIKSKLGTKPSKITLFGTILIGFIGCVILYALGGSIDMQTNKFPPNLMFFFFSLIAVSALLLLVVPNINTVANKIRKVKPFGMIFDLFSNRSITIFLYQSFAFLFTIPLVNRIPMTGLAGSIVKAFLCLITTILICAGFAAVFGRLEDLGSSSSQRRKKG